MMRTLFKLIGRQRQYSGVLLALAVLINLITTPLQTIAVHATGSNCLTSTNGAYTVTPCITAPADGATLTGEQTVSATYTTTGANPGVAKFIFYLNGQYLIAD